MESEIVQWILWMVCFINFLMGVGVLLSRSWETTHQLYFGAVAWGMICLAATFVLFPLFADGLTQALWFSGCSAFVCLASLFKLVVHFEGKTA